MKKPKEPREPYKPYPPTAPVLPPKEREEWVTINHIELSNYDSHSLPDFIASLNQAAAGKKPEDLQVIVHCEVEHGYYDDVTVRCGLRVSEKRMVPNSAYTYEMKGYELRKKQYAKEKEKYEEKLKQYKSDLKTYKNALEPWKKYQKELTVARLKKQLKQLESE